MGNHKDRQLFPGSLMHVRRDGIVITELGHASLDRDLVVKSGTFVILVGDKNEILDGGDWYDVLTPLGRGWMRRGAFMVKNKFCP